MLLLMHVERDSEDQGPSPWAQVYSNTLMFLHFSPSDSFGVLSLQCGGRLVNVDSSFASAFFDVKG